MSTTAPPLPLTTVFTPPVTCSPTPLLFAIGYYNIYYDATQFDANVRTGCWPSGYSPTSAFSPAPFSCPVGFSVACATAVGEVTTGVCCPSGWPCAPEPWSSLMTNSWPCGGFTPSGGLPLTFTGLYDGGGTLGSKVYGTTTLTAGSISGVASLGLGVFIEWQKSDLPPGATPLSISISITSTDSQTTTQSLSVSGVSTASNSSTPRNSSTSSPSSAAVTLESGLGTGAKAGIGIGIALFVIFLVGLAAVFVLRQRKSRTQIAEPLNEDVQKLPPQLASKIDAPELDGERGAELDANAGEKQKNVRQIRITELEAELSRLRGDDKISELP